MRPGVDAKCVTHHICDCQAERMRALEEVLDPIRHHHRPTLREKVTHLKQTDGEGWAVGEMLERACILLDALEMKPEEPPC